MHDPSALIDRLDPTPHALEALLAELPDADAQWKPPSGAWSIVEVVNHMADEDAEDFRARLERTLRDPEEAWPGIDPEGSVRERRHNEKDLRPSIERFGRERRESMRWLRSLDLGAIDWAVAHHHPKFGPISAGALLASWAAHDALHLRQIAKRLFELAGRDGAPHPTAYAGEWGA